MKPALPLTLLFALPSLASAADLMEAYQKALQYDSGIATAQATYEAEQEESYRSRATLLPNVSAFANGAHTDRDADRAGQDSFRSSEYGIRLTQPLFRADTWYVYAAAEKNSLRAEAEYNKAQQELILNVATAYFNVLRGEENLRTTKAAEAAFQRQYDQARERFEVGLVAITEVHESKADYDAARTARIRAEGDLDIARETLARLTGEYPDQLDQLKADFPVTRPMPDDPDQWQATSLDQNWSIKAAEYGLQARRESLSASKSGHAPTLDLSASLSRAEYNGPSPADDTQDDAVIALSLNVPLYEGGGTQAGVRKARAQVREAESSLDTVRRNVKLNTRTLFRTVNTNIDTVASQKQTIVSRQSALEATQAGYSVGTRNIVEVLDAERNYYVALRDYANARYDYVINSLNIKQAAGTLSPQDLIDLNQWLAESASQP